MSDNVKPAEVLRKEIIKRYDSDPRGWHTLVRKDHKNFYDIIFSQGSEVWIIKEQPINPFKSVGYGVTGNLGELQAIGEISPISFGLRPVAEGQINRIVRALSGTGNLNSILAKIMQVEPVTFDEIQSPMVIQGPIAYSTKPTAFLSKKHRELDLMLRDELEKLLLKKYPQTLVSYL